MRMKMVGGYSIGVGGLLNIPAQVEIRHYLRQREGDAAVPQRFFNHYFCEWKSGFGDGHGDGVGDVSLMNE